MKNFDGEVVLSWIFFGLLMLWIIYLVANNEQSEPAIYPYNYSGPEDYDYVRGRPL